MKKLGFLSFFLIGVAGVALLFSYLFLTTKGSDFLVSFFLPRYFPLENIESKEVSGSLFTVLSYQDIVFDGLEFLPEGNSLRAQRLDISLGPAGLRLDVKNGTLVIPGLDKILFYGFFENGNLDLNFYTRSVNLRNLFSFFDDQELKKITGLAGGLDAYVRGPVFEPSFSGVFQIDSLSRENLVLENSAGNFDLAVEKNDGRLKLFGEVSLNGGKVLFSRAALINLDEARFVFSGNPQDPSLDVKANSVVERTKINISLKGTMNNPDLHLKSSPSLSQERLLLMLATNRSWRASEGALSGEGLSADMGKEFFDYFVFSRPASNISKLLRLGGISIRYDNQTIGVEARKDITETTEISFSVEQARDREGEQPPTQKVGIEHQISESTSLSLEGQISQDEKSDREKEADKPDSKAILKFRREF